MLKFHDDPTVNESKIVIYSETGLVVCGKKRGFWEEKGKNENEGKRRHRQSEN